MIQDTWLTRSKLARSGDHQIQQRRPKILPAMDLNSETSIFRLMEEVKSGSLSKDCQFSNHQ